MMLLLISAEVWGDKRPSYNNLKEILALYATASGKKREIDPPSHFSEEVVKGKGKEKANAKKKGGGSKKGGSSKSC